MTPRHSLRRAPLAGAACLIVGNLFMHLPISDVCDWAREQWGFPLYDRVALVGIPVLTLAVLVPLLWRQRERWRYPLTWCVTLSLLVMTLAAQRWMLVANIEIIHFPQFGLIAGLLLAAGLTAEPAWLLATAAGILDETYQQLVIYAARKDTYLDFNDMILDAIGAAWIVVLFAPHTPARASWMRWPRVTIWLLPLIALAWIAAPPQWTPFLRPSAGFTLYRVIGITEAITWAAIIWGMIAMSRATSAALEKSGWQTSQKSVNPMKFQVSTTQPARKPGMWHFLSPEANHASSWRRAAPSAFGMDPDQYNRGEGTAAPAERRSK